MSRPVSEKLSSEDLLKCLNDIADLQICARGQCGRSIGSLSCHQVGDSEPKIEASGQRDLRHPDLPMTEDTIIDVASITKLFTTAALMKLWDKELKAGEVKNFPDGIDTKIEFFMEGLKNKFGEKCADFFSRVEGDADYHKITLRDLLNHTHGLGKVDSSKLPSLSLDKEPLELDQIIAATKKVSEDRHGAYRYSNFGTDFAAMIIEVITDNKFEDVMKDVVLRPYHLDHTYTQGDVKMLHSDAAMPVARGCIVEGIPGGENKSHIDAFDILTRPDELQKLSLTELHLDCKVVTRASSNFKTTMKDLAKFGRLFLGAEMFESEEIKTEMSDGSKAAIVGGGTTCHLAALKFKIGEKDVLAHGGYNSMFRSNLQYDPATKEVEITASPLENVTNVISLSVLREVSSLEDRICLKEFMDESFKKMFSATKEEKPAMLEEMMKANPKAGEMLHRLTQIQKEVFSIPIEDLMKEENREKIMDGLVGRARARGGEVPSTVVTGGVEGARLDGVSNKRTH